MYSFGWNQYKSKINQSKHGVTFEEAMTVFYDENALLEYDNLHSNDEDRFRILGSSELGNILLVVHCIREEKIIRIISARKAMLTERRNYERVFEYDKKR